MIHLSFPTRLKQKLASLFAATCLSLPATALADETCMSRDKDFHFILLGCFFYFVFLKKALKGLF